MTFKLLIEDYLTVARVEPDHVVVMFEDKTEARLPTSVFTPEFVKLFEPGGRLNWRLVSVNGVVQSNLSYKVSK